MTVTSAADVTAMIARAVDYEGEWPEVGGMRGNRLSFSEIIAIGERVRGASSPVVASVCCIVSELTQLQGVHSPSTRSS